MKKILKSFAFALAGVMAIASMASCDNGPQHNFEWESDATKHRQVCKDEGCEEKTEYEPHEWGEWQVTTAATEDAKGLRKHTCTVCNYVGQEAIPELKPTLGVATKETAVYAQVPADWETVYFYYWNGLEGEANTLDKDLTAVWPGFEMVEVNATDHIWGFKAPAGIDHVIFSNENGVQTEDIEFALSKNLYVLEDEPNSADKYDVIYRSYTPTANDPELPGAVVVKVEKITLYAQVPAEWTSSMLHFWGVENTAWPGNAMELVDETNHIYKYDGFITSSGFIINSGDGSQTADLKLIEGEDVNIIIVADDNSVSYGKYANGVITPVEVEIDKTISELYVVGTMNSWSKNNDYKLTIDGNTATIEITLAADAEFKVFDGDWAHSWATFGYIDSLGDAFADNGGNIKVVTAGTYTITVSDLDATPALSITVKP